MYLQLLFNSNILHIHFMIENTGTPEYFTEEETKKICKFL